MHLNFGTERSRSVWFRLNFGVCGCCRDHSMCFSHLGVFLISVKPLTTENTENKTGPKICKTTVHHNTLLFPLNVSHVIRGLANDLKIQHRHLRTIHIYQQPFPNEPFISFFFFFWGGGVRVCSLEVPKMLISALQIFFQCTFDATPGGM